MMKSQARVKAVVQGSNSHLYCENNIYNCMEVDSQVLLMQFVAIVVLGHNIMYTMLTSLKRTDQVLKTYYVRCVIKLSVTLLFICCG